MSVNWIRKPAVAGRFYPDDKIKLKEMLAEFLGDEVSPKHETPFLMAPHAGYIYSGRIAAEGYRRIKIPDTVILACPNHTGLGNPVSIWSEGEWITPLGNVPVDSELTKVLEDKLGVEGDEDAHAYEHANEVHVPFLQWLNPNVKIVPVTLGALKLDRCLEVGKAMAEVIASRPAGSVLTIASTDMSHYLSAAAAKEADAPALKQIETVNPSELYLTVVRNEISMCGFIPTTCVLEAISQRGLTSGKIVRYGHSGEVTSDSKSVVSYATALFS